MSLGFYFDFYGMLRKGKTSMLLKLSAREFLGEELGQDLVEYALVLVFLAMAAIATLPILSNAVNNVFSQSASSLTAGS